MQEHLQDYSRLAVERVEGAKDRPVRGQRGHQHALVVLPQPRAQRVAIPRLLARDTGLTCLAEGWAVVGTVGTYSTNGLRIWPGWPVRKLL